MRDSIGVFDSGMGGLTVLRALRKQLPGENFVYLGDTARLPYGTKSPQTVIRYAEHAAGVLIDRGVRALVVACNTASGIALEHLGAKYSAVPVFGVVHPGAEAASVKMDESGVLVLATESTVAGGAYQKAISRLRRDARVYARACPLWVTLAEQGIVDGPLTAAVVDHDLRGFNAEGPRTILLGCTHYPVFKGYLRKRLPGFHIVDSAETTALVVASVLGRSNSTSMGEEVFLATDGIARFKRVGRYFLGRPINDVELIDLQ